jgi:hypothetical protein
MVGGVFLSRPRPYMGCSAWKYGVVVVKGEEDAGISAKKQLMVATFCDVTRTLVYIH